MSTKPIRFGLIVTGRGEVETLHEPFNAALAKYASCVFEVVRRCEQLRPRTSDKRHLKITGSSQSAPTRDEELGLAALGYLRHDPTSRYLLIIDDLEGVEPAPVFDRYRKALDSVLSKPGFADRAAVHFLVNMLEAYFFAHVDAVNAVAGRQVLQADHADDVEAIDHPKGRLLQAWSEYREIDHGTEITRNLDVEHVLSRSDQCCWLRALIAWCVDKLKNHGSFWTDLAPTVFRLDQGCKTPLTFQQTTAS